MKVRPAVLAFVLGSISLNSGAASGGFIHIPSPAKVKFCTKGVQPRRVTILREAPETTTGHAASNDPRMVKAMHQYLTAQQRAKMNGPVSRSVIKTPSGKFINFYRCQAHFCPSETVEFLIDPKTRKTYGVIYEESSSRHQATHQFFGHPNGAIKGYLKGLMCKDFSYSPPLKL